ncbi:MAG: hypothetical protein HY553_07380 [Elusimicrobia bacterium]|nr:hypothetical protein [Elusimicrobiota bacterium]
MKRHRFGARGALDRDSTPSRALLWKSREVLREEVPNAPRRKSDTKEVAIA